MFHPREPSTLYKNEDGSLGMCIDYSELNKVTIKNEYPLSIIDDVDPNLM